MIDRFANLTACCDGNLSIENLERFQRAMREYEVFMAGMRELLAPLDEPRKLRDAAEIPLNEGGRK
jgi:hypothetical protein